MSTDDSISREQVAGVRNALREAEARYKAAAAKATDGTASALASGLAGGYAGAALSLDMLLGEDTRPDAEGTYPHSTRVVASRREGGKRTTFRAVCDRGDFNGPSRTMTTVARNDGNEHERQVEQS